MNKYRITIWNPGIKTSKEYTKPQVNKIIKKILEKEKPYKFFVWRMEPGCKTLVYEYKKNNDMKWTKKI